MCGICGIFNTNRREIVPDRVIAMRDAMTPRGPDAAGFSAGPGFALGHRRLAIIDLSPAGEQPMTNEDGTVHLVFNGEIYNFQELVPDLVNAGHRFRSHSDSEVLIHGFEEWGLEGLLHKIRGMYAFAIYDRARHAIHLARDPLGKKPLFFHWKQGDLAFASSARALVLAFESTPEIDIRAVDDLLWNLYIPGPRTVFRDVEKLQPGHALTIDGRGSRRDIVHWSPSFMEPERGIRDQEWLERVEIALDRAVRRRLISDVPLGALLSGGVDSSLVTAFAARAAGKLRTFSVATEDPELDESAYALSVAERYGTDHTVLPVRGNVRKDLIPLVASMGEPLSDASAINVYAISRTARESVTVALTGDGGDEGFGGYSKFRAYYFAGRMRKLIPEGLHGGSASVGLALRQRSGRIRSMGTLLRLSAAPVETTFREMNWLSDAIRNEVFTEAALSGLRNRHPGDHYAESIAGTEAASFVDRAMQAHIRTILPDDYLAKVDCATMAASLEARSPFLDQDLIELAMRIPAEVRFRGGEPKALLRRLARRYLPHHTVNRRKQGFVAPIELWFRRDWADVVNEFILGPNVERRGWFRRQALERIVHEHRNGQPHGYLLWSLLVLELWIRLTVDRTLAPTDSL